jgi:flagellar basal body P-ring protein FlgI
MKSPWAASLAFLTCGGALLLGGCSTWNPMTWRSQSPEEKPAESKTQVVGDLAVPYGMFPVKVESFGLVTKLPGTGSDPPPSIQRAEVLADMKSRNVAHPSEILASKNTAVVVVRGVLRPGIQEGDRFDLEVHTSSQDETTSLRGGWLMETRLKEMAILQDAQLHEGHGWGIGEGAVLVDPNADSAKDRVMA